MGEDIGHECGVAALYWLGPNGESDAGDFEKRGGAHAPACCSTCKTGGNSPRAIARTSPGRDHILHTFKALGGVTEAFRMSHPGKTPIHPQRVRRGPRLSGIRAMPPAAKTTCAYAQPFERQHGRIWKWFGPGVQWQPRQLHAVARTPVVQTRVSLHPQHGYRNHHAHPGLSVARGTSPGLGRCDALDFQGF